MYNRYIPEGVTYTKIEEEHPQERPQKAKTGNISHSPVRFPDFLTGKTGLSALLNGGEGGGLSGLLKTFHLDNIDTGDVLLLLIILYLLVEGDDLELVIALGLVLLMGLGEE